MFSYYGSKSKLVNLYPAPEFGTVIEPFAGSARYALKYFERDVVLIDKEPDVIAAWHYLQQASEADVLGLPRLRQGERIDSLSLSDAERAFLGFLYGVGRGRPALTVSPWAHLHFTEQGRRDKYAVIAGQLHKIRHWRIVCGDYACAGNVVATWFIDPPYQVKGRRQYRFDARGIDFAALSEWVASRRGQVIACENVGADWLPFRPLATLRGAQGYSQEAIWTNQSAV